MINIYFSFNYQISKIYLAIQIISCKLHHIRNTNIITNNQNITS